MAPKNPKQQIDEAVIGIDHLLPKIHLLGNENKALREERDWYMADALASAKLMKGILDYHHKVREVMKKFAGKDSPLDRELRRIKPPKLK